MSIETHTRFINEPVLQTRTEYKVEDDRSFIEKAKDAIKDAAHTVKEVFTPDVKDEDIAKAEMEEQDLRLKEEMDRRHAAAAQAQQARLRSHAEHLQNKEFGYQEQELYSAHEADKQAEKVAKLKNKQAEQQAEKCHEAMKKYGACPMYGHVKVTRVTEIH